MNPTDLKRKLASLWKNTFHDSDEFISMLFDNYFNPELAEYEEVNGDVVSGLIGIPYNFGNADSNIKGLCLCNDICFCYTDDRHADLGHSFADHNISYFNWSHIDPSFPR